MSRMTRTVHAIVFVVLASVAGSSFARDLSGNIQVPADDPAMQKAIKLAQGGLDGFLDIRDMKPVGTGFYAVKIGIKDVGSEFAITDQPDEPDAEFFWVGALLKTPSGFSGEIQEIPESVSNVSMGQRVEFKRSNIMDWLYFEKGKMKGNFTACPALAHATDDSREAFNKQYGTRCK